MLARLLAAVIVLVGCASMPPPTPTPDTTSTPTPSPTPTLVPTLAPTPSAAATRPPVTFTDGTHRVPEDVPPGTYRTTAYTTNCLWSRLAGFDGALRDVIVNVFGSGYQVVSVAPDDAGFEAAGCGTWTSDLSAVTASRSVFSAGTYIVGTDIEAGTYESSLAAQCAWARLRGFGGTPEEVIESGEQPTEVAVVQIGASDAGFTSTDCGTWRRR